MAMTVEELIEELRKLDGSRLVIIQKDGEGNGYSPLSCTDPGAYLAESTWSGSSYLEELTPELRKQGYSEADLCETAVPALFLVPTN